LEVICSFYKAKILILMGELTLLNKYLKKAGFSLIGSLVFLPSFLPPALGPEPKRMRKGSWMG
jgi:hypothetical protein